MTYQGLSTPRGGTTLHRGHRMLHRDLDVRRRRRLVPGYSIAGYRELRPSSGTTARSQRCAPTSPTSASTTATSPACRSTSACASRVWRPASSTARRLAALPGLQHGRAEGAVRPAQRPLPRVRPLLRGLRPRAFVLENVPGLVRGRMRLVFADMLRELEARRLPRLGSRPRRGVLRRPPAPQAPDRGRGARGPRRRAVPSPGTDPPLRAAPRARPGRALAVRAGGPPPRHRARHRAAATASDTRCSRSGCPPRRGRGRRSSTAPRSGTRAVGSGPRRRRAALDRRLPAPVRVRGYEAAWAGIGNSVPPPFMRAIAEHVEAWRWRDADIGGRDDLPRSARSGLPDDLRLPVRRMRRRRSRSSPDAAACRPAQHGRAPKNRRGRWAATAARPSDAISPMRRLITATSPPPTTRSAPRRTSTGDGCARWGCHHARGSPPPASGGVGPRPEPRCCTSSRGCRPHCSRARLLWITLGHGPGQHATDFFRRLLRELNWCGYRARRSCSPTTQTSATPQSPQRLDPSVGVRQDLQREGRASGRATWPTPASVVVAGSATPQARRRWMTSMADRGLD